MPTRKARQAKSRTRTAKRPPRRSRVADLRTDQALDLDARMVIEEAKPARRAGPKAARGKASSGSLLKRGKRMLRKTAKEIGKALAPPRGKRRMSRKDAERALMIPGGL